MTTIETTDIESIIKRDAIEFGMHSSPQRRWRLGLLVARNVEAGSRPSKKPGTYPAPVRGKWPTGKFSAESGVAERSVQYHLKAWDLAFKDGVDIPASKDLSPGEDVSPLPSDALWTKYYNLARHGSETPPKATPKPTPAPKAAEPPKKPTGKAPTPGAVTIAKIDKLKAARADFPTETKDGIAKIAGLAGHQEVRLLELISEAPSEMQSMIEHDELKLSVAQEILEAPLLDPAEKTALAKKFVAGTFPQVGQAKKVFRPIVAFAQNARPAAREMLLTDVSATVEQVQEKFPPEEKRAPKVDPTAALKWSLNFSKAIHDQKNLDQHAIVRLTDSRHAAETMKSIDPYTMSFVVKDMQLIREMIMERYGELEWWITTLAGADQVNHPTSTETGTATVDAETTTVDADADPGADIIEITSKRMRPGSLHIEGMTIDG